MSIRIQAAQEEDLSYIVEVYNSIIPGRQVTADLEPVTAEDWLPWFQKHHWPSRPVWILFEDDQPCGWMSFSDYYGRPAYYITAEVSIYLAEEFRNKGLGKQFLQMGLDYIRQHEVRKVIAFIYAHNRPSIMLFEQLEFVNWGLLPGVCLIDETELDVVILGLEF